MNCLNISILTAVICLFVNTAFSQKSEDARNLVKEGIELNNQKNYTGAIEKYRQALTIDTGYLFGGYQLALSLYATDKGTEGIKYLEKIAAANSSLKAPAYDLLSLIYFKNKKYAAAEQAAIEGIKLEPGHAGSMRTYALVTFHQNKRANALLGFCSFILLEPHTARSVEAMGNIRHILQGGALKTEPGEAPLGAPDENTLSGNKAITTTVAEAAKNKYASGADQLAETLKNIFLSVGRVAEKESGDDFFRKYLAAYFYQLAQSDNMPAFARLINMGDPENEKWIQAHSQQMTELNNWLQHTERELK